MGSRENFVAAVRRAGEKEIVDAVRDYYARHPGMAGELEKKAIELAARRDVCDMLQVPYEKLSATDMRRLSYYALLVAKQRMGEN